MTFKWIRHQLTYVLHLTAACVYLVNYYLDIHNDIFCCRQYILWLGKWRNWLQELAKISVSADQAFVKQFYDLLWLLLNCRNTEIPSYAEFLTNLSEIAGCRRNTGYCIYLSSSHLNSYISALCKEEHNWNYFLLSHAFKAKLFFKFITFMTLSKSFSCCTGCPKKTLQRFNLNFKSL